jgi:hypothetical protein
VVNLPPSDPVIGGEFTSISGGSKFEDSIERLQNWTALVSSLTFTTCNCDDIQDDL